MRIEYSCIAHPLPPEFVEWYPYAKPSVMLPRSRHWLDSMKAVIGDSLPGLEHHPELAHFGWFLVEEPYRGKGIGRAVLDNALGFFQKNDVQVVMLPTMLSTVHARGMYGRRGFVDLIAERQTGRCWMIRQPDGYFDGYFTAAGEVTVSPLECGDWLAFDYLLNHERVVSRLYPVGLTGEARVISFTRASSWPAVRELAIRRGTRMCGFIVCKETGEGIEADFYSPDPALMDAAVERLLSEHAGRLSICTAAADEVKREVVARRGMRRVRTFAERPFGKDGEEEFIEWRG